MASDPKRPQQIALRTLRTGQKLRIAMHKTARLTNRGRAFVATLVSATFLWAIALSVSPQLHSRIHSDANRVEHNCAATFVASGNYEHTAPPLFVSASLSRTESSTTPALNPLWVPSPFLSASIFEHAPPEHS
jgi:hypothetical protein